jgi:hypothetical protein
MRTIKLNVTYITTSGKEFTPIEKAPAKSLGYTGYIGNQNMVFQNEETRYIDANGNRIKKSNLSHIKGEKPVIRPQGTI